MGGQSRRGRSTLAHGSLCRDAIDRWDPLERGCRSTSRPCCGPAHQLFVLELERASRSHLVVPITDGRNGLLRSGLLQYNDADELVVLPPSAVASVGPNGGNRYRKCDDLKSVTDDSDNLSNPGLHQPRPPRPRADRRAPAVAVVPCPAHGGHRSHPHRPDRHPASPHPGAIHSCTSYSSHSSLQYVILSTVYG